ncbi:hypothetical protein Tco_0739335 [Tanacetum coccineum]
MDGINIDDITIEQYLRLTKENQTPSMVRKIDDMAITEYIEYEERMKRQYSRNSGSYFPTYSGHCTSSNNTTVKFPRNTYFNSIQPNTEFNYDSKDMELDEEAGYTTDGESVMSEHEAIGLAHTVNTQSFEEELSSEEDLDEWAVHKNKQISVSEADLKKSFEAMEDTVNNDSFTSNLPYQPSLEELNPRSFLLPFTIDNYNSYVMANIDASDNVMPRSIYEYLKLDNLGGPPYTSQEEESFNPLKIGQDLFSYESPACLKFEQDARNYDTIDTQNEIARQTNPLLDKKGLTKRWHVCKTVQVFYDDGSGEYCGMWPTCNPNSSFCYGYKEVFEKSKLSLISSRNFDVEEEYTKEIRNQYSRRFDEYKQVFDNEVEQLSNEYTLRIEKKGYVLDDVWEK